MRSPFRRDRRELQAAKSLADHYDKAVEVVDQQLDKARETAADARRTNERIRRAHLERNGFTEMLQAAWSPGA
ncbi:hypothetical protein SEA_WILLIAMBOONE_53 [Gordonia phage WilliamBoone]|nr:hypothetical protein SEA_WILLIAMBOONE_53 [Gordonia phage WilliamBoone]